ncbi:protein obstructor-E-like [Diabrotica virgifera virgifera]|uniref:Chitin-binding type-2 domain-containing protein n=1 Tax=Diabrotica virgifera virgifera TaxID=50390 RepID=A0ABM5JJX5_DIAVI|nr:protein obstructor-E-like [Diabrotica virgifera virgifera]
MIKYLFVVFFVGVNAQFQCPQRTGFFPDLDQCDLYYVCSRGQYEQRLCPDGLVFDDKDPNFERCETPANVDCTDRPVLQQAKPSPGCPRQNGFYRHPKDCTKFHSCVDGKPKELNCPAGLVYDEEKSICIWAASSKREECLNPKKDALDDGFECPIQSVGNDGRKVPHPTYAHPSDCQKFYICRNGVDPQKGSCSPGTVYNEDTSRCDDPKNVEGCENYYSLSSGSAKSLGAPSGSQTGRKN